MTCGIGSYRFWSLSPAAVFDAVEVHAERDRQEWRKTAQLAAWILSAWTENPPSADRLLGWEQDGTDVDLRQQHE